MRIFLMILGLVVALFALVKVLILMWPIIIPYMGWHLLAWLALTGTKLALEWDE